jgi:hypothetical protein
MIPCRLLAGAMLVCACAWSIAEQPRPTEPLPPADAIMARVAANQDRAESERAHYVYVQHAKMVSRHGGTVKCEEITDYRMTPSSDGFREQLLNLDGRQLTNHKYLAYHALSPEQIAAEDAEKAAKEKDRQKKDAEKKGTGKKEPGNADTGKKDADKQDEDHDDTIRVDIEQDSLDRDLVENIRSGLIHDKSKDGISAHLFPLTSKDQADYAFRMVGREHMNGRDVYHVAFRPKKKDDWGWSGDAYVDTQAYEPVLITTVMARKIPFAVRTFLGINVPGLGFTVTYAPQPDGVWFPVNFSTEFKIKVLFFFNRQIILDAQNRDFEKTHVTSRIVGDATEVENKQP